MLSTIHQNTLAFYPWTKNTPRCIIHVSYAQFITDPLHGILPPVTQARVGCGGSWLRRPPSPDCRGGCRALSPVPLRFRFRLCPWRGPLPLLSVTDIPLHSALELSIASVEDGSPCRPGPSPRSWRSHTTMRCPCLPMRSQDRQRLSPESGHALGPHITHTDCRGLNDVPEDSETSDSRQ